MADRRWLALLLLLQRRVAGYTTLSVVEFYRKLTSGEIGLLIDTRAANEWAAAHLPNATFVERLHAVADVSSIAGCQSCSVAVYCHSGYRSKQAATVLEAAGFTLSVYPKN